MYHTDKCLSKDAWRHSLLDSIQAFRLILSTAFYQTNVVQLAHSQSFAAQELNEVAQLSDLFYAEHRSYAGYCSDANTVSLLQDAAQRSAQANGHYSCNDGEFGFAASIAVDTGYVCIDASAQDPTIGIHRDAMSISDNIGTNVTCH
jgi:predicted aspartyl protease